MYLKPANNHAMLVDKNNNWNQYIRIFFTMITDDLILWVPAFSIMAFAGIQAKTQECNVQNVCGANCMWVQNGIDVIFVLGRKQINSLSPGKCEWKFRLVVFKLILVIYGWVIGCEIALRWMSTLVQVKAYCRQAASQCVSKCWPR